MSTRIILDTRRPLKDGTFPLRIFVAHGTNMYLPTGFKSTVREWNARTQMFTGSNAKKINKILSAKLTAVVNAIITMHEEGTWGTLSYAELRKKLTDKNANQSTPTLYNYVAIACEGKKSATAATYKSAIACCEKFCDPSSITVADAATKQWCAQFVDSIRHLKPNSQRTLAAKIGALFNLAMKNGLIANNPLKDFKFREEETFKRSLSIEQLRCIRDMDLPRQTARARDIFMLIFYLIGINISDLQDARLTDIINGRLEYTRNKTGKKYSIKVEPEAAEIIKRIATDDAIVKEGKSFVYNQLEKIKIPDFPFRLSTYWARHTWASIAAELDIPRDVVSESLGHSYGCSTTAIYIKYSLKKIDEANRRVIDELNKQKT